MATEVTKADTTAHDDQVRAILAKAQMWKVGIISVVALAMLGAGEFYGHPFGNGFYTLLGGIVGNEYQQTKDAFQYYFGGSSGSTAKSVASEKATANGKTGQNLAS